MSDKNENQENQTTDNEPKAANPIETNYQREVVKADTAAVSTAGYKWTIGIILLISIIIIVWLAAFNKPAGELNGAVAVVNGEEITKDKLYDRMFQNQGLGNQMLDALILEEIIKQEAAAQDVVLTDEELNTAVDEQMEEINAMFPTKEQLDAALAQQNLTLDVLRRGFEDQLRIELLMEKLMEPQVDISEENIAAHFETYKAGFTDPEKIKASHILVEDEELAKTILQELKDGADFAELAQEHSIDTTSAVKGGDLDYFGKGQMVPAFEEAAFALQEGEISEPVKSDYGYHIIKVTDIPKNWTLEEKKEEVKEDLFNKQLAEKAPVFIEELRAKADIEKNV
jgi:foldase protein PrsA